MNKKITFGVFLLLVALIVVSGCAQKTPQSTSGSQQLTIKTGTYAGECREYCRYEFVITPEKVIYTKSTILAPVVEPTKTGGDSIIKETSFSSERWGKLIGYLDIEKFNSIPSGFCRDEADQGCEWIGIVEGENDKTVYIDGSVIARYPELGNFVEELRKIRTEISSQFK